MVPAAAAEPPPTAPPRARGPAALRDERLDTGQEVYRKLWTHVGLRLRGQLRLNREVKAQEDRTLRPCVRGRWRAVDSAVRPSTAR